MMLILAAAASLCIAYVTDGDTVRLCSGERVRIVGIDAPELGPCRRGRRCTPGDGQAARAALAAFLRSGRPITIHRAGADRYGRTLADIRVAGRSAACHLLATRHARPRYDGGATARRCRR